jgi:hypothetical protein
MASRKNLKKTVNFIVEEIVTDCLVQQALKDTDEAKVDEVLADVLALQNEFLARTNHTEPNNVKAFYKDFYTDFNARVDAIYAKIDAF